MKNLSRTRMVVAGAIVGLGTVVGVGAAGAATPNPYPGTPSTVPEVLSATAEQAPVAEAASVESATAQNSLAFTGGDAAGLAAIGAVALAAGTAITVSRRRTAAL
jgi:hypothetical protein